MIQLLVIFSLLHCDLDFLDNMAIQLAQVLFLFLSFSFFFFSSEDLYPVLVNAFNYIWFPYLRKHGREEIGRKSIKKKKKKKKK